MTIPRSTSLDELERQSRVAETDQVVLVADSAGPPSAGPIGPPEGDAPDGDGD